MERQTITVDELSHLLGIGRNSAYQAVEKKVVRALRIGKRILIPVSEVERLLNGKDHEDKPEIR